MARRGTRPVVALVATLLCAGADATPVRYHLPDQVPAELRPLEGPGFEAARNNCMSCHSVDYVTMQPPRAGPKFWEAEVTKMIKVYRAPIDEADAKLIADYLAQAY